MTFLETLAKTARRAIAPAALSASLLFPSQVSAQQECQACDDQEQTTHVYEMEVLQMQPDSTWTTIGYLNAASIHDEDFRSTLQSQLGNINSEIEAWFTSAGEPGVIDATKGRIAVVMPTTDHWVDLSPGMYDRAEERGVEFYITGAKFRDSGEDVMIFNPNELQAAGLSENVPVAVFHMTRNLEDCVDDCTASIFGGAPIIGGEYQLPERRAINTSVQQKALSTGTNPQEAASDTTDVAATEGSGRSGYHLGGGILYMAQPGKIDFGPGTEFLSLSEGPVIGFHAHIGLVKDHEIGRFSFNILDEGTYSQDIVQDGTNLGQIIALTSNRLAFSAETFRGFKSIAPDSVNSSFGVGFMVDYARWKTETEARNLPIGNTISTIAAGVGAGARWSNAYIMAGPAIVHTTREQEGNVTGLLDQGFSPEALRTFEPEREEISGLGGFARFGIYSLPEKGDFGLDVTGGITIAGGDLSRTVLQFQPTLTYGISDDFNLFGGGFLAFERLGQESQAKDFYIGRDRMGLVGGARLVF